MNISSDVLTSGIRIIVVFMLFALTVFLHNVISQYEISGDELLINAGFGNKFDGWRKAGNVTVLSSGSQTVVRLKSENNKKIVTIKQMLENINREQSIRLSGTMKIKGVGKGDKVWQAARIIFVAVDTQGRSMYNVPHVLVMRNGTTGWETYSKVFVTVSRADHYYVEIQLVNVKGVSWVKDLSLRPVKETLSYRVFQSVVAIMWLIATFWILSPYWRIISSSKKNVLILLMLIAALFASLVSTDLKYGFIESLKPFLPWVEDEENIFRLGHFLAYSMISIAVFWNVKYPRVIITFFGLLTMFSMATEILQYLVDGRTPRISDFLVDVSGVLTGLFISYMLSPSMRISLNQKVR